MMLCVSAPRAIPDADYGEGCSLAPKKRLSAAPEVFIPLGCLGQASGSVGAIKEAEGE